MGIKSCFLKSPIKRTFFGTLAFFFTWFIQSAVLWDIFPHRDNRKEELRLSGNILGGISIFVTDKELTRINEYKILLK